VAVPPIAVAHADHVALDEHAPDSARTGIHLDDSIGDGVARVCRKGVGIGKQRARADIDVAGGIEVDQGIGGGIPRTGAEHIAVRKGAGTLDPDVTSVGMHVDAGAGVRDFVSRAEIDRLALDIEEACRHVAGGVAGLEFEICLGNDGLARVQAIGRSRRLHRHIADIDVSPAAGDADEGIGRGVDRAAAVAGGYGIGLH
jgi:hypothetical protein